MIWKRAENRNRSGVHGQTRTSLGKWGNMMKHVEAVAFCRHSISDLGQQKRRVPSWNNKDGAIYGWTLHHPIWKVENLSNATRTGLRLTEFLGSIFVVPEHSFQTSGEKDYQDSFATKYHYLY